MLYYQLEKAWVFCFCHTSRKLVLPYYCVQENRNFREKMPAVKDLKAMLSPVPFVRTLCDAFTGRFVIYISIVYFCIKGFANRSISAVQLPYFQTFLKTSGDDYQKFYNVSMMAFAVKPLLGTISDNIPIFGYHKRYYLAIMSAMGAAAMGCSTLLSSDSSNGPIAAGMFFVVMLSVAAMDLLCEGKYSELMEKRKDTGSSIISWIWAMYMLGGIIASAVEGPLADDDDPRIVLLITAPFFLIPIVPSLLGWVPEEKKKPLSLASAACTSTAAHVSSHDAVIQADGSGSWINSLKTAIFFNTERKRIIALSLFASFAAIGLAIVSLYGTNNELIYYIVPTVIVLFIASFQVLPPVIAKATVFMFCKELVYIQMNGPLDYFYTDKDHCIPDSPHFSYTYYQTFGNIVTNVGGMLGVYLFQKYLSTGRFRTIFWLTTFIKVGASFFDVVIILRWNREYLGIDDHVMYMCGDAIITQLATMLDFMPASVLISRLCPRGMESTMFALLAGMSNFGQNLSRSLGVVIAEWLNVKTSPPCNTDNLYLFVMIGHMVAPLLILPLSVFLVPNTLMQEVLPEIAAAGEGGDEEVENGGEGEAEHDGSAAAIGGGYGSTETTQSTTKKTTAMEEEDRTDEHMLLRSSADERRPSDVRRRSSHNQRRYSLEEDDTRQSIQRAARASMGFGTM